MPPYWTLFQDGEAAARLVVAFENDDQAKRTIADWMDATHSAPMKSYIERTLYDLVVTDAATVGFVRGGPQLFVWLHAVADNQTDQLPEELGGADRDVLLMPRRESVGGRLVVVSEAAWGDRVVSGNKRSMTW